MSKTSDGFSGKLDMSTFETQFEETTTDFGTLAQQWEESQRSGEEVLSGIAKKLHLEDEFKAAMTAKNRPNASLEDRLRYLKKAFNIALELQAIDALPSPNTLSDLKVDIIVTNARVREQGAERKP